MRRPATTVAGVATAVAVAVLALLLAGCGGHGGEAKAGSPASASASPTPMLTPTAAADTPLGAGERVWAAFSLRGLPQKEWFAQLRPLLSPAARAVYVYNDPSRIPEMSLKGPLRLSAKAPDQADVTSEVIVPTSLGTFKLDLERRTAKAPWLLYAIVFPPGVG